MLNDTYAMDLLTGFALMAVILTVSSLMAGIVERAPLSFPMIFLALGFLVGPHGVDLVHVRIHDPALEVVATTTLALVLFLDAVNLEVARERREWLVPALSLGPVAALDARLRRGDHPGGTPACRGRRSQPAFRVAQPQRSGVHCVVRP